MIEPTAAGELDSALAERLDEVLKPPPAPTVDVDGLMACESLTIEDILDLRRAAYSAEMEERKVDRALKKLEKEKAPEGKVEDRVKYGVCLWILRKTEAAEELLGSCRSSIPGAYVLGRCLLEVNKLDEAAELLEKTAKRIPSSQDAALAVVTAFEKLGRVDEALKLLRDLKSAHPDSDVILYHMGFCYEMQGFHDKAQDFYNKALEKNTFNEGALFQLAYRADLYGDEETAVTLYRRCLEVNPPNVNAMLNLGVLYEDMNEYQKASECYESVLKTYPNHPRAQAFLKDALASMDMVVDEEREKKEDKLAQILRIPVTDFELSVRSRNCLKKMEIQNLGDLITKTEAELLSYKNFGETSLAEIKAILESKGLSLGMDREKIESKAKRLEVRKLFEMGGEDVRMKPIAELGLSIRARKCMDTLNVRSVGDLLAKSEAELLRCKNFGMTSLQDVRQKLAQLGLELAKE